MAAPQLAFDTTFLIDSHRERASEETGPARRFLQQRAETLMCISAIVLGEFAEGFEDPHAPAVGQLAAAVRVWDIDPETALIYAKTARVLRASGRMIGANDLWIAASALRHSTPLVTRNTKHFARVPGLAVIGY